MRSIGRFSGKMGSNEELIAGLMEGMDPRAIAEAINKNAGFMAKVMSDLDPKAIADSINEGLEFASDVMKYMDPEKVAAVINKNERLLPRYIECINPNVFTLSAGSVVSKLRKDITAAKLFGKWLPQIFSVFTPFAAWLMGDLKTAISIKLDDGEWTCELSKDGFRIDDGLSDDALVTVVMSEKDFLSVVTGERKMAMMPPSVQLPDLTKIPEMAKERIEILKGIEAVLLLKVEDPDAGDLVAKVKFAGPMKDQPDTEVVVSQDVLEDIVAGALDPAGAFILGGQVQVEGDVNLLMKLAMMLM